MIFLISCMYLIKKNEIDDLIRSLLKVFSAHILLIFIQKFSWKYKQQMIDLGWFSSNSSPLCLPILKETWSTSLHRLWLSKAKALLIGRGDNKFSSQIPLSASAQKLANDGAASKKGPCSQSRRKRHITHGNCINFLFHRRNSQLFIFYNGKP